MSVDAFRLRRDLDAAIPAPVWPQGFTCRTLTPPDAPEVHRLLVRAYTKGRGVAVYAAWWAGFSGDPEFDAALCFLVFDERDEISAVALCWISAFLKDLAVDPARRRLGLGENLLRHVFRVFQERGAAAVDLKVEAHSATAIRLYRRAGMVRVPFAG